MMVGGCKDVRNRRGREHHDDEGGSGGCVVDRSLDTDDEFVALEVRCIFVIDDVRRTS
jgi:hypothetical protein